MLCRASLLICLLATSAAAQSFRDANCDGHLTEADRGAVASAVFAAAAPSCTAADVNRDGRFGAADLVAFAVGPRITFIGLASSDGHAAAPLGRLPDGAPVYFHTAGFSFQLVVEVANSPSGAPAGTTIFNSVAGDPARRPDFQILVDRKLGDGSRAVCDEFGVPAIDPPDFAVTQAVSNAINDLACRFEVATRPNAACTQNSFGQTAFLNSATRAQFCLPVTGSMAFASGETRVTVQVRDQTGLLGPAQQMVLQVAAGPVPPTFTPVPPTATPSPTETASPTATASPTRSASATRSVTRTATPTRTFSNSPTPTRTDTRPPSPTRTPTPSPPATGPAPRTPLNTATPTRSGTATITPLISSTPTRSATRTPTTPPMSPSPTRTRTTNTATRTRTPSAGVTATRTRTATPTPTATAAAPGPLITFFGLTRADDVLLPSTGAVGGVPVFEPSFGFGFSLIVEVRQGTSRRPPGLSTFSDGGLPDLQIQVTRPLGNGSAAVCDDTPPTLGGVPAINPPSFADSPTLNDRVNDLACRFVDGIGAKIGRQCGEVSACVLGTDGNFGCAIPDSSIQYCGFVGQILNFPSGDTLVTARVRDTSGNLGPISQMIVRVR
ncbi:MAG: hypothetical protein ABI629_13375 [bacterium]